MGRLEVAYYPAWKAELLFENLGQDVWVFAAIGAIDLVIRAHDGTDMAVFYSGLERKRINLLQGAFVELCIDFEPILLAPLCSLSMATFSAKVICANRRLARSSGESDVLIHGQSWVEGEYVPVFSISSSLL